MKELDLSKISQAEEVKGFKGDFYFLSNMYPIEPFTYQDITYNSSENLYQSMKTMYINKRLLIAEMSPKKSKTYCSKRHNHIVIRNDWETVKFEVMEIALKIKFSQPEMKKLLLLTRDIYLEETNAWNDIVWGVCIKTDMGSNRLGYLIMKIRRSLGKGKI
jgi:ribA/ribD-fused uncharacterized protein